MLTSTEIQDLVIKLLDDNSNELSATLNCEDTFNIIKYLENKPIIYGYKNKKAMELYYKLESICDIVLLENYFNQMLCIDSNRFLEFTNKLFSSDLMFYKKDYFKKGVNKIRICELWFRKGSFRLVKKALKYHNIFYDVCAGKEIKFVKIYKHLCENNDDRVFKLCLNYVNKNNIIDILKNISMNNTKFFLKRLKLLNNQINLCNYFDKLLDLDYKSFDCLKKVIKIYQNNKINIGNNFKCLTIILNYVDITKVTEAYIELKEICIPELFKKLQYLLIVNWRLVYFSHNLKILIDILENNILVQKNLTNTIFDILRRENLYIYNNIPSKYELADIINKKFRKEIIEYIEKIKINIPFLVLYTNYFPIIKNNIPEYKLKTLLSINKIKSFLRIKLKIFVKKNQNSLDNKRKRLLNELVSYLPKDKPVLLNGCLSYQLVNESFHSKNPPTMVNIEKNYGNPYLTLKIDGIQVNRIPSISKYKIPNLIRAEYYERKGQQIFMLYDINLPNMTYIERVCYLRKLHQYNLPEMYNVSNLSDLLKVLKEESKLELKWFNENKNELIVWYPKAFIKYTGNIKKLSIQVLLNKFNPPYLNYKIDGLILNSGNKDYKLKPKNMHTIDIKFNNGKWYLKNNECLFTIINPYNIILENENIYRCYPADDNTYYVKDKREDKIIPNSLEIINLIRNSYFQLSNNYYQKKTELNNSNFNEIKNARRNEIVFLRSLNLNKKLGILDLCSGKGNILKSIPKHFYYTLIDKTIYPIKTNEIVIIKRDDLTKIDLKYYKDDYWICINGLWYIKDNFIRNLKKYKPHGIIFNTHKKGNINWKNGKSFLIKKNKEIRYYYEWCHNNECSESYLIIDDIWNDLEKLDYKLVKYHKNNDDSLSSNFEFYYFSLIKSI